MTKSVQENYDEFLIVLANNWKNVKDEDGIQNWKYTSFYGR